MKLCLVCSSGGHLFELFSLDEMWSAKDHFWVSFATQDASYLLKDEKVYWAHYPTNRNILNLFRNLFLAWKVLKKEKPDIVISTGAGVGVPFLLVGWVLRKKTIYIELITRIDNISLSGLLVYPFVDKFLVQWEGLVKKYRKAEFHGRTL